MKCYRAFVFMLFVFVLAVLVSSILAVEDLKRATNKDIGPKDIFEVGSNIFQPIT